MRAAGGGVFKSYRPRFPFNPNEGVWSGNKSFIFDDPPLPLKNDSAVADPALSVPQPVCVRYLFDGNQAHVGQDKLSLGDTRQFRDLTLLSEMPVLAMLDHGHMEHLGSRRTIDIFAGCKGVRLPGLPGEPRNDARFDRAKVRHDKLTAGLGDERRADELRERLRNGAVEHGQRLKIPGAQKASCGFQIGQVVLGQIL